MRRELVAQLSRSMRGLSVIRWEGEFAVVDSSTLRFPDLNGAFRPGDIIARCFHRLGFHQTPGCKCAQRQQAINLAWANFTAKLKGLFHGNRLS